MRFFSAVGGFLFQECQEVTVQDENTRNVSKKISEISENFFFKRGFIGSWKNGSSRVTLRTSKLIKKRLGGCNISKNIPIIP